MSDSLYINKDELIFLYNDHFKGEVASDKELDRAVEEYNGRMDNFAEELIGSVLDDLYEGIYKDE